MRRLVCVAVSLVLLAPATASAGTTTVAYDGTTLRLTADGEPNSVTLSAPNPTTIFIDAGAVDTVTAPASCTVAAHSASCPKGAVTTVTIDLAGGVDFFNGLALNGYTLDIKGGAGNDTLATSPAADTVDGGPGNDTIGSGGGADTMNGGDDDDTLTGGGSGAETFDGGAGNDLINANEGADTLRGGPGNDTLNGQGGADALFGDAGNDTLDGGEATDTYDGGADVDRVTYVNKSGPVTVTFDEQANDGAPGENENVTTEGVIGSFYADTLTGGAGADLIDGYSGDDLLSGGPGADTLDGGADIDTTTYASRTAPQTVTLDGVANDGEPAENDNVRTERVIGGAGGDTLTGGTANDGLAGGPGVDTLRGGAGDDSLNGGPGADALDGEAGINTADYSGRPEDLTVDLADSGADGAAGENDKLANFRGIVGGSGNDVLRLAPSSLAEDPTSQLTGRGLNGGDGNDQLFGTEAADRLEGGPGTDTLTGYSGPDYMIGGVGADRLEGGNGNDRLYGDQDKGNAFTYSENGVTDPGDGDDVLLGGEGGDIFVGGGGADTLEGGGWDDSLWGGAGADTISGGDGGGDAISFEARGAGVNVTLGTGVRDDGNAVDGAGDTIAGDVESVRGTNAADTIVGSDAGNSLVGLGGDDTLRGGGGDDSLDSGIGGDVDVVDGGPGFDTVTFANRNTGVNVSFDGVANDGGASEGDNVLGVEGVIGSNVADTLTGTGANEYFDGRDGNDTITASGGNDVITGGFGLDTLDGGDGDDQISAHLDVRTLTLSFSDGSRDVVRGGAGDDRVVGSNDQGGNDLDGGAGVDMITYEGDYRPVRLSQDGVANDGVIAGGATDNVSGMEVLRGGAGADTITGGGDSRRLEGLPGADTITGGAGDETLVGDDSDDKLTGGGGDDVLDGGNGKDTLVGGDGVDTVTYAGRVDAVVVTLDGLANDGTPARTGPPVVPGEQDNADAEIVAGSEGDDRLVGSAGANVLRGGVGNDRVEGGDGDDALDGGPGVDVLVSGAGVDLLDAADGEADTLTCDTRAGKTVNADVGLDALDTCADPAALGGGGDAGVFGGLGPGANVVPLGAPPAVSARPTGAGVADRSAAALARLVKLKRSVKVGAGALLLGSARCAAARPCTLRVIVRRGKKVVGRGVVAGTGSVSARAYLLRPLRKPMKVTVEVTIVEGGSRATVHGPVVLRRAR